MQNMPLQQCPQVNVQPQQPAYVSNPQQAQTVQVPNYSGVNIQIFNPSVGVPGGAPVYNVNAPQYGTPSAYPAEYYMHQMGQGNNSGYNNTNNSNNSNNTDSSSSVSSTTIKTEEKKTEKREIVELTDTYIKNLENYLNSQDREIRLMGAKDVAARLQEDKSRRDDKALTALINKMLQDPYQPVRFLALSMLDLRHCTGDDYTVALLQNMQKSNSGYGQDALQASEILLRMSAQHVKKEFDVEDLPNKKEKTK